MLFLRNVSVLARPAARAACSCALFRICPSGGAPQAAHARNELAAAGLVRSRPSRALFSAEWHISRQVALLTLRGVAGPTLTATPGWTTRLRCFRLTRCGRRCRRLTCRGHRRGCYRRRPRACRPRRRRRGAGPRAGRCERCVAAAAPARRLTRAACALRSAQTAVTWPPPAAPPEAQGAAYGGAHGGWAPLGGDAAAHDGWIDEAYDEGDYDEGEEDKAYDAGASFVPGEVVWRAGDALDEDEDDYEAPEVELELSEEWAARFAQTEHRRAQRACSCLAACVCAALTRIRRYDANAACSYFLRLAGKLQERAANRQGQAPEPQRSSASAGSPSGAPAGPPLTVVDIVRAAGAGASQPNEGARSFTSEGCDVCARAAQSP